MKKDTSGGAWLWNKSLCGAYDFFRAHSAQCEITFFFAPFFLEISSLFGFSVLSLLSLLPPPQFLDLRIVRAWCAHSLRMQRGWFAYFSVSPLSCFFSLSAQMRRFREFRAANSYLRMAAISLYFLLHSHVHSLYLSVLLFPFCEESRSELLFQLLLAQLRR